VLLAWQLWLTLAVLFAIGELVTGGFFLLWFSIGAVISALAAVFGLNLVGQIVAFLAISGLLVVFTRPLVHRFVERRRPAFKTNVDALSGKVGTVVRKVDPLEVGGLVKVQGEIWTAVTAGAPIPKGALVVVERVEGVKLHVQPVSDRQPLEGGAGR